MGWTNTNAEHGSVISAPSPQRPSNSQIRAQYHAGTGRRLVYEGAPPAVPTATVQHEMAASPERPTGGAGKTNNTLQLERNSKITRDLLGRTTGKSDAAAQNDGTLDWTVDNVHCAVTTPTRPAATTSKTISPQSHKKSSYSSSYTFRSAAMLSIVPPCAPRARKFQVSDDMSHIVDHMPGKKPRELWKLLKQNMLQHPDQYSKQEAKQINANVTWETFLQDERRREKQAREKVLLQLESLREHNRREERERKQRQYDQRFEEGHAFPPSSISTKTGKAMPMDYNGFLRKVKMLPEMKSYPLRSSV